MHLRQAKRYPGRPHYVHMYEGNVRQVGWIIDEPCPRNRDNLQYKTYLHANSYICFTLQRAFAGRTNASSPSQLRFASGAGGKTKGSIG